MTNSVIVIEKNVPIPPASTGRPTFYPWDKMQPNDSFAVPVKNRKAATVQAALMGSARKFSKAHPGVEFTSRREADGKTVRVWRKA